MLTGRTRRNRGQEQVLYWLNSRYFLYRLATGAFRHCVTYVCVLDGIAIHLQL
jgi:hypothetical protein